jgi:hypothetical protein
MADPARPAPLTPLEIPTFAREQDRKRLSRVAIKAFKALAKEWALSNVEAAALLATSTSTWERLKRSTAEGNPLNQDQLTRISALVGVYKGLHLLFADAMADKWPRLNNSGALFNRRTPIEAMIEGGIPFMLDVRRYVDAVRGGL